MAKDERVVEEEKAMVEVVMVAMVEVVILAMVEVVMAAMVEVVANLSSSVAAWSPNLLGRVCWGPTCRPQCPISLQSARGSCCQALLGGAEEAASQPATSG